MRRRLDHGDFERRPDDAFQEMPAARRAVLQAEHRMHMQAGLAVVADGDIAQQAQPLALLVDLDRAVRLGAQVEPSDGHALEGANGAERCAAQTVPVGEVGECRERFVAGIEHDDEGAFARVLPDQPGLHRQNRASRMMIGMGIPNSQSRIPRPMTISFEVTNDRNSGSHRGGRRLPTPRNDDEAPASTPRNPDGRMAIRRAVSGFPRRESMAALFSPMTEPTMPRTCGFR